MCPADLLRSLKKIESGMGRQKMVEKGPRNIDLDILFYNVKNDTNIKEDTDSYDGSGISNIINVVYSTIINVDIATNINGVTMLMDDGLYIFHIVISAMLSLLFF